MQRFTVVRVEQDLVTLTRENRSYQLPLSLFSEPPKKDQSILLSASIAPQDGLAPDPLARDLLNDLLSPSS